MTLLALLLACQATPTKLGDSDSAATTTTTVTDTEVTGTTDTSNSTSLDVTDPLDGSLNSTDGSTPVDHGRRMVAGCS